MVRTLTASLLVAVAAAFALASPAGADPVKLRAAWIATPASLIPILFAKAGIAQHLGVSYQFEEIHFNSSPTEVTALASGEIEIGTLGFSSVPIAIQNAGLTDLRIIADETQDGFQDYATVQYMVLKDSAVKTPEDLKGKIVAVNGIGAGVELGLRAYLLRHGLAFQRDYSDVEVPFANMKAVLFDHKAELITGALPFVYDPELTKGANTLFTLKDALNGTELSVWVMRSAFIAKNRAAVVDLLEDMVRSYRWFADPANHKEAVEILARYTKQPVERLDDWAFTKRDTYRDPNGLPDLGMLQSNVDALQGAGFIKTPLDVAKYADLSLVKEAAARIK
jgi:sulfonate transport system substrate-binding protein